MSPAQTSSFDFGPSRNRTNDCDIRLVQISTTSIASNKGIYILIATTGNEFELYKAYQIARPYIIKWIRCAGRENRKCSLRPRLLLSKRK